MDIFEEFLNEFKGALLTRLAAALKLSEVLKLELVRRLPGLAHSHCYRISEPDPDCAYCRRLVRYGLAEDNL